MTTKKVKRAKRVGRTGTPPPAEGRVNCKLQTENYWESLDIDVQSCEAKTQTMPLHELPINPWFTPSKLGEDKGTEILPGDLFNFDCEVQPIVETLVGKVVEQVNLDSPMLLFHSLESLLGFARMYGRRRTPYTQGSTDAL